MKHRLIFSSLLLSTSLAYADIIGLHCSEYQTLFPIETFTTNSQGLEIEADQSEISQNNEYLLTGNATVKSNSHMLAADEISISKSNQSTLAKGNAKFQDARFLITSNEIFAEKQNDELLVKLSEAKYQQIDTNANGAAQLVSKTTNSILFENATYSLCPLSENDWLIQADSIKLDFDTNRGLADDAVIKFFGYPIFYYPLYQWVLEGRGTGFLTPEFERYTEAGDNNKHTRVRVPYYFNLAPDRDLLVALNIFSNRGTVYEGTYRQLLAQSPDIKNNTLIIEGQYLSNDDISKTKRWLIDASLELDINEKVHLSILNNRVSDKDYFKDIVHGNTSEKKLDSHIKISLDDPDKALTASILSEDEQVINAGTPAYTRAFEVAISKGLNTDSSYPLQTNLSVTKFAHDTSGVQSGFRSHAKLGTSKTLNLNFPKITTRADVGVTHYLLDNSDNITRTTAGFGVDFAFPFTGQAKLYSTEATHQFTPKITYNYRAKQVQGNIPIFDTTDKHDDIITFADLTSGERYTGLDRITNANDVTLSLESDFIGKDSNKSILNMSVAQSFYADDEVVSDTASTDYETRRKYSDIAASANLSIGDFSFNNNIQFDPDKVAIVKRKNTFSYQPSPRKFASISSDNNGTKKTFQLYGAYPITDAIHLFGGIDKNTSIGITNNETTGIAYESCCWAFRLAHFKEHSGSGSEYDYSTSAELIFKGLGSSSFNLQKRIEENIPFYHADLSQ